MRILIAGSKGISSKYMTHRFAGFFLDLLHERTPEILTGAGYGVEAHIRSFAELLSLGKLKTYRADWEKDGKKAGHIRNRKLVEDCDVALLLWDGKSQGVLKMAQWLEKLGKPYMLVKISTRKKFDRIIEINKEKNKEFMRRWKRKKY